MAESTIGWNLEPSFCRNLRSKDLYLNLGFHPSGFEESSGTPCWCMKTQQVMGPDGDIVQKTTCMPERSCYEADEL
jgi:hypothetical protein